MDWAAMGARIRKQREYMKLTREQLAELLDVTPKFCADIELGNKGISVQTLCRLSNVLRLSTDYILFGEQEETDTGELIRMLKQCTPEEHEHAEQLLKVFFSAMRNQN